MRLVKIVPALAVLCLGFVSGAPCDADQCTCCESQTTCCQPRSFSLRCCRCVKCCIPQGPPAPPRGIVVQSVPAVMVAQHALAVHPDLLSQSLMIRPQSGAAPTCSGSGDAKLRSDLDQLRKDVNELSESTKRLTKVVEKLAEKQN